MTLGRVFILSLILSMFCVGAFYLLVPGLLVRDPLSFDGRAGGYDLASARAYLQHLEAANLTEAYRTFFRWIDSVFPVGIFGLMASAIWGFWGRPAPAIAVLGVLVCCGYLVADYVENAAVGALLTTGPNNITAEAVNIASSATQGKWVAILASGMLVILGLVVTLIRGRD